MGAEVTDFNGEMARRGLVLVAVAAGLLAGCTDDRGRSEESPAPTGAERTTIPNPTTTLPDLAGSSGLAASIRQFREDEVAGVIQVELVRERSRTPSADASPGTDPTADLVTVTSVQLVWPGFEVVPPTRRDVKLAPGQRVDVPTPLGAAVCTTGATPSFSLGTVVTVVTGEGGVGTSVNAPLLADAQTALDNVWTKACVQQRLLDRVGVRLGPWARSDPGGVPTATGTVLVERRDTTEPIAVTGVDGSVLLFVDPASPGELSRPLAPGGARLEIGVVATGAGRCDGHALSDSKKTYVFQVLVEIGDDDPVGIDVAVPEPDRPLLNQVIVDTCSSDRRR